MIEDHDWKVRSSKWVPRNIGTRTIDQAIKLYGQEYVDKRQAEHEALVKRMLPHRTD